MKREGELQRHTQKENTQKQEQQFKASVRFSVSRSLPESSSYQGEKRNVNAKGSRMGTVLGRSDGDGYATL